MENDLLSFDPSSVWRPSSLTILDNVLKEKKVVKLLLARGFDDKSLPTLLTGHFVNVANNLANFVIDKKAVPTPEQLKTMIDATGVPEASIDSHINVLSFVIGIPVNNGFEPTKFTGTSSIVKTMYNTTTGEPHALFIHVNNNLKTRRIRRDTRYPWNKDINASIGLETVNSIPQTKAELRNILNLCASANTQKPTILNISAGGICLIPDLKFVKMSTSNLFFMLLSIKDSNDHTTPFFLLMKKLGLFSSQNKNENNAVRFIFSYELDWTHSSNTLEWIDIKNTGSDSLRSSLGFLLQNNK